MRIKREVVVAVVAVAAGAALAFQVRQGRLEAPSASEPPAQVAVASTATPLADRSTPDPIPDPSRPVQRAETVSPSGIPDDPMPVRGGEAPTPPTAVAIVSPEGAALLAEYRGLIGKPGTRDG